MNLSIDDAINLHRCIEYITKDAPIIEFGSQTSIYETVCILFTKRNKGINISYVSINEHESVNSKEKLQEYFNE